MLVSWVIEIWESEPSLGIRYAGQRHGDRIGALIVPERKVIDLHSANAQNDSQSFQAGRLESHDRIETRSALLDKRKVKSRRIGDRLHSIGAWSVGGNGHEKARRGVDVV